MDAFYAAMRDEYIEFAKKVTAFRSLPGEEKPLADFFLKEFEKLGVEAFRDGAGNVLAVLRGTGGGPNVMLNGHLDIVPEGELSNWAPYDPFDATLVDGELIGRGLSDLKGGLCAQFFAFRQFVLAAKQGRRMPGNLLFALVTMEEPAESMGTEYLFDVTLKELNLSCDLVYLSEPTSGDLALGHRGKVNWWWTFSAAPPIPASPRRAFRRWKRRFRCSTPCSTASATRRRCIRCWAKAR